MHLTLHVPTAHGQAPVLLDVPAGRARFAGTVLVYHGLGACKEVQVKECAWLASAGLLAASVDAVGHGERRLPDFDVRLNGPGRHQALLELVLASVQEVPAILDALGALLGDRAGGFGVAGISMGGYIAFGAAVREPRLRAVVPIIGAPDWTVGGEADDAILRYSPHLRPEGVAPKALLAFNAARDRDVPPAASREFVRRLRPFYEGMPDRLAYHEYAESEHTMREDDWNDLWQRATAWLLRYLA